MSNLEPIKPIMIRGGNRIFVMCQICARNLVIVSWPAKIKIIEGVRLVGSIMIVTVCRSCEDECDTSAPALMTRETLEATSIWNYAETIGAGVWNHTGSRDDFTNVSIRTISDLVTKDDLIIGLESVHPLLMGMGASAPALQAVPGKFL